MGAWWVCVGAWGVWERREASAWAMRTAAGGRATAAPTASWDGGRMKGDGRRGRRGEGGGGEGGTLEGTRDDAGERPELVVQVVDHEPCDPTGDPPGPHEGPPRSVDLRTKNG